VGDRSHGALEERAAPADDQDVMLRRVDRARPTFWQRVAILMATQLLTVLALILCTAGTPWAATPASGATTMPRPVAVSVVSTVGNGYEVRRYDSEPTLTTQAGVGMAPPAVPTPATLPAWMPR
jgi:hypothetical protein